MSEEKDRFISEVKNLTIEDIAPDNGKTTRQVIGEQPWWVKLQMVLIAFGMFILLSGFVGLAVPFEPYEIYSWRDIPDTVCPGEVLRTSSYTEIKEGPYTVGSMTGYGGIVNDQGIAVDTWEVDVDVQPYDKELSVSPILRRAPLQEGYYRLLADVTLDGRMFGYVPRYQDYRKVSEKRFYVLDEADPRCTEGGSV